MGNWIPFVKLFLAGALVIFVILVEGNPFGLGQILIWQMRPPYHWHTGSLVDSKGVICATVYRPFESSSWRVYGLGFNETYSTQADAQRKAVRECR